MAKQIIYDSEANEKILAGVNKLEKAVSSTLGPCGKNVIIDEYGAIHSTKDGVTVARSVVLSDKFENLGANAIREVAEKSNDRVGDGTTTSTLLAASIYRNGLKYINVGANATQVKNGIKKAADFTTNYIQQISKEVADEKALERVATVSANGDNKIGHMIAEVMHKIGNDGTIKVENGNGLDMTSKIVEGMVLDQTYVSPYMVTNGATMEAELDNPFVIIANKKLSNFQEMLTCLQSVSQTGRPMLVIADDYAEDVLASMVMNKLRGLSICAIKSPSYGDNRKALLDDIAILCGGKVISDETMTKIEDATIESGIIGQAKRVVVNKDSTIIFNGCGNKDAIDQRISNLRSQIAECNDDFAKGKMQDRLAKLSSGIGIISVGATTEAERKELRDRVDDAFAASKAALRKGVVAGGGSALLYVKKALDNWNVTNVIGDLVGDETIGVKIFCDSLETPIRKILDNAGIDSSMIVAKILDTDKDNVGYDVLSKKFVDMIEAGILDPTEVVMNEVQNAASVAGLLLTTEALIVEETVEQPK